MPFRDRVDDPLEILRSHRLESRIGRGIQEIDGVGNAVLHRELHGVQIVAERAAQLQAIARPCARPSPATGGGLPGT